MRLEIHLLRRVEITLTSLIPPHTFAITLKRIQCYWVDSLNSIKPIRQLTINLLTCLRTIKSSIKKLHSHVNNSQTASRLFRSVSDILIGLVLFSVCAMRSVQWTVCKTILINRHYIYFCYNSRSSVIIFSCNESFVYALQKYKKSLRRVLDENCVIITN